MAGQTDNQSINRGKPGKELTHDPLAWKVMHFKRTNTKPAGKQSLYELTGAIRFLLVVMIIFYAAIPQWNIFAFRYPSATVTLPTAKLTASDKATGDQFGSSVAIDGDVVVVGAMSAFTGSYCMGAAYVFMKQGSDWSNIIQVAKLNTSDPVQSNCNNFGKSVAISGDTIVIGARSATYSGAAYAGAAYVYVKPMGGWSGNLTQTAKLSASDKSYSDNFGTAVAIDGDVIVIGADSKNNISGEAYAFQKPVNGWAACPLVNNKPECTESVRLRPSDSFPNDFFGLAVDVDRDKIIVGAPRLDGGNGKAYIYVKPANGWAGDLTETGRLMATDGASGDAFGWAVAIQNNLVVVGAKQRGNGAVGGVYVFSSPTGNWAGVLNQSALLLSSQNPQYVNILGSAVEIQDNVIVASAPTYHGERVLIFEEPAGGWSGTITEATSLARQDHPSTEQGDFGVSVALNQGALVVGDDWGNPAGLSLAGAAYVYTNQWRGPLIAGSLGPAGAGATLAYADGTAIANSNGDYSIGVRPNWTGSITPSKAGYSFSPPNRSYTNLTQDQAAQDYVTTAIRYTISGNAGIGGATLSYIEDIPKTVTASPNGNYSMTVAYNWSGRITPSAPGYLFRPEYRDYTHVLANLTGQDYIAALPYTISGNTGISGVFLIYLDGIVRSTSSDASGNYSIILPAGWSGTITPFKLCFAFSPHNHSYDSLEGDRSGQDFTPDSLNPCKLIYLPFVAK